MPYRPKLEVVEPQWIPGSRDELPVITRRMEMVFHSISMSPAYSGKSFEELRLEDYELGRDAGKWWIGGTLQVNNDRDMAAALDALQLGLPSDSNSVEYPTYGFPKLDNEGNIIT